MNDLLKMENDITSFAKTANAPFDAKVIKKTLNGFKHQFQNSPIEFSTSTKSESSAAFDFISFSQNISLVSSAVSKGLLHLKNRPVDVLIQEIEAKYPRIANSLVANAHRGVKKISAFLANMYPVEQLKEIKNLPFASKKMLPYLQKHGLAYFSIISADYQHASVCISFAMRNPFFYTPDRIKMMIEDLEITAPDEPILQFNANAVFANLSFSYKSQSVESISFSVPCPMSELVPVQAHPLLKDIVEKTPFTTPMRAFIVDFTFGKNESYIQIKTDYTGTILGVLATSTMLKTLDKDSTAILLQKETDFKPLKSYNTRSKRFSATKADSKNEINLPKIEGKITQLSYLIKETSADFGHISRKKPQAVVRPNSIADVQKIISFANENNIPIAMRGQGHSSFGQAQSKKGIVVDSRSLSKIHEQTADSIWVEAGATFREILVSCLPTKTPLVMPDYIDLSVGGVLSNAGVSGTTQHFGFVTDTVLMLEVVTTSGELLVCSKDNNADLFKAILGGLGQYGIIVKAQLKLGNAPFAIKFNRFFYENLSDFMQAQRTSLHLGLFEYLEGLVVPHPSGEGWMYVMQAAQYFYGPPMMELEEILKKIPAPINQEIMMLPYVALLSQVVPFEFDWKRNGFWTKPHPWLDIFLPDSVLDAYAAEVLAELHPSDVGPGFTLIYPFFKKNLHCPMVAVPDEEVVWLFDILRFSDGTAENLDKMLDQNQRYQALANQKGGKRYPISAVSYTTKDWKAHYGENWESVVELKKAYDPNGILATGQGIGFF